MKTQSKLLFRKILKNLPPFLSIVLIIAIGVGFFITLKTILYNYQEISEQYYEDHRLANYTLYGRDFNGEDIEKLEEISGIKAARPRVTVDAKRDNTTLRMISLPQEDEKINILYYYQGAKPREVDEALISRKYAQQHNLAIGDSIVVKLSNNQYEFRIAGIVASPEYVYLSQSTNIPMADPYEFGIMYVNQDFFLSKVNTKYNEVILLFERDVDEDQLLKTIKSKIDSYKISNSISKANQTSYKIYQEDLSQIDTFAYIFPIVFLMISSIVIYVLQKRNVAKERKQIGIIKALGCSDISIIFSYTGYAVLLSLLGSLLGCGLSTVFGGYILSLFGNMFEVPNLELTIIPRLWLISTLIALVICILANYAAVRQIIKINPAEAMHAEKPKDGKRIFLERFPSVWRKLTFNTRYSLKTALRNKGRFMAMVFGMIATITLTLFSLGFKDSFDSLINTHYDDILKYHLSVEIKPTSLKDESLVLSVDGIDGYNRALMAPIKVSKDELIKDIPLMVVEQNFNLIDLRDKAGKAIILEDGVVIPSYYAEQLGVSIGDSIKISSYDGKTNLEAVVSNISEQGASFALYTTYDYLNSKIDTHLSIYNYILIKAESEYYQLQTEIEKLKDVNSVTSVEQDKNTLIKLMKTINVFIVTLIGFAIVLGVTVLYSVSTINLTARNYEFILLNVMGYSTMDIMLAYIKETSLQLAIALPLGIMGGYGILSSIKEEFSNDSFMLKVHLYPRSFIYALLIMIAVILFTKYLAKRHIDRLDIVEGLKAREE